MTMQGLNDYTQVNVDDPDVTIEAEDEDIPDSERYWASRSEDALATELKAHEQRFYDFAERRGYTSMWAAILQEYFGLTNENSFGFDSEGTWREGEDGELIRFRVNALRRLIRQSVALVLKGAPTFQVDAANTESQSRALASELDETATALYQQHVGKRRERMMVERGKLYAKMWWWVRWDPDAGPMVDAPVVVDPRTGAPLLMGKRPTGAPVAQLKRPWEVITPPCTDLGDPHPWAIVKETVSRWQVLAEIPDDDEHAAVREHIRKASVRDEIAWEAMFGFDPDQAGDDDLIREWFYHPPCEDLPEGRCAVMVSGKLIKDGPWLGFPAMAGAPAMPLVEYMPATLEGSALGYSDAWDLVPTQQMLTQLTSDAATNLTTHGRQVIIMDEGSDVRDEQLVNGMTVIRKQPSHMKPEGLNLAALPAAWQPVVQFVMQSMERQVGKDGDPSQASSGTMAALIDAIELEHQGGDIDEVDHVRGELCTLLLATIQQNATVDQMVSIVGSSGRATMQKFSTQKLSPVQRVRCKPVSPVMKSRANQMQVIEFAIKAGLVTTMEQLIEFFASGTMKPATRIPEAQSRLIEWENEQLRAGNVQLVPDPDPKALPTDPMTGQPTGDPPPMITPGIPVHPGQDPFAHVCEHFAEIDTMEDDDAKRAAFAHIKWHMRVYEHCPPLLAMLAKMPPPPSATAALADVAERGKASQTKPPSIGSTKLQDTDDRGPRLPKPAEPPKGANA